MTKFRGFGNSTIKVKKRLGRGEMKQVQKLINTNKRLKHQYQPIGAAFFDATAAGGTASRTYFQEIGRITASGGGPENSALRSSDWVQLQSYNVKMGINVETNDATTPVTGALGAAFRIIIVRSREGSLTDIVDVNGASITTWVQQPDPDIHQVYTDEIFNPITDSVGAQLCGLGYLMHFYKSFKKKNVPYMIQKYDGVYAGAPAISNGIYMKVIIDPNAISSTVSVPVTFTFGLNGFCHLKWFDKN